MKINSKSKIIFSSETIPNLLEERKIGKKDYIQVKGILL
jgi:hypothetical protein